MGRGGGADREALERLKVVHGADHPETLITMNALGVLYRDSGRPAEALPLLEEAVRLHAAKLGSDHITTMIMSETWPRCTATSAG